jgi:hypothetical protein
MEENKMQKHVTVVASIQVGYSLFLIIAAVVVLIVLRQVAHFEDDREVVYILWAVGTYVPLFLFVLAIPGLVGGIGLFMYKRWARIVVLIVSALDMLSIPVGLIIGVYSIWVLVQDDTVKLFNPTAADQ